MFQLQEKASKNKSGSYTKTIGSIENHMPKLYT